MKVKYRGVRQHSNFQLYVLDPLISKVRSELKQKLPPNEVEENISLINEALPQIDNSHDCVQLLKSVYMSIDTKDIYGPDLLTFDTQNTNGANQCWLNSALYALLAHSFVINLYGYYENECNGAPNKHSRISDWIYFKSLLEARHSKKWTKDVYDNIHKHLFENVEIPGEIMKPNSGDYGNPIPVLSALVGAITSRCEYFHTPILIEHFVVSSLPEFQNHLNMEHININHKEKEIKCERYVLISCVISEKAIDRKAYDTRGILQFGHFISIAREDEHHIRKWDGLGKGTPKIRMQEFDHFKHIGGNRVYQCIGIYATINFLNEHANDYLESLGELRFNQKNTIVNQEHQSDIPISQYRKYNCGDYMGIGVGTSNSQTHSASELPPSASSPRSSSPLLPLSPPLSPSSSPSVSPLPFRPSSPAVSPPRPSSPPPPLSPPLSPSISEPSFRPFPPTSSASLPRLFSAKKQSDILSGIGRLKRIRDDPSERKPFRKFARKYLKYTRWNLEKVEKLYKFIEIIYGDKQLTDYDIEKQVAFLEVIGWDVTKAVSMHFE
jgi:hypothetical protein